MRKLIVVAASVAAVLAMAVSALAADLQNGFGAGCPTGETGTFHFVNNQSGTTTKATIVVEFSGGVFVTQIADKVTPGGTQHFFVKAEGTLVDASTTLAGEPLPGNLVLSGPVTCSGGKKGGGKK
jgi:hypothetical protein